MCTAYEIGKRGGSHSEAAFAVAAEELLLLETRIIRPTLKAPVLLPDGTLTTMSWGFRRPVPGGKTKQLWRTIVNSREDKLDGRMWAKAFRERRCLIPASAFYEWVDAPRGKGKVPLRFVDPGGGLLWIAGIWEDSEKEGLCYSMITTEPTTSISSIHDRMPAVLAAAQVAPFLAHELNEFDPSEVPLEYSETENFLKKSQRRPTSRHPPAKRICSLPTEETPSPFLFL